MNVLEDSEDAFMPLAIGDPHDWRVEVKCCEFLTFSYYWLGLLTIGSGCRHNAFSSEEYK